ncbi:MAG: DUF2937 family protein [Acidisphaera sp.]|nr:DUF2937 family protein [Acidisphaera sp.]
MKFLERWLSDTVSLVLALVLALLAMQAPALTRDYAGGLLQVAQDIRRDIDQRESSARQYYNLPAGDDDAVIAALQTREPSNAATLAQSIGRAQALQTGYDQISAAPPLLQPVVAAGDALRDAHGYKRPVLRTALDNFTPQIVFSMAAAIYGLAGLVLGTFLGSLFISAASGFRRPARRTW